MSEIIKDDEGMEYEILEESTLKPVGHDQKGNPLYLDADGKVFNPAEIAEYYDKQARKDAAINMRISSYELMLIKKAAASRGYRQYQKWVHQVLTDAVENALKQA